MFLENRAACAFLHLVNRAIHSRGFYMLNVRDYKNTQSGKTLLGYYDDDFYYIKPDVITDYADKIAVGCGLPAFNMRRILETYFALNIIKVHWVLTDKVRYRPQKRVGKTRNRYITFHKGIFDNFHRTEEIL